MDVDPREIERMLLRHAGISEAAVIVVPDGAGGKTVRAIVAPAPGARLSAAEVLAFASSQLAADQAPNSVEFVLRLPEDLNPPRGTARREDGST